MKVSDLNPVMSQMELVTLGRTHPYLALVPTGDLVKVRVEWFREWVVGHSWGARQLDGTLDPNRPQG